MEVTVAGCRLEVLLGTFRETTGTKQWLHSTARLFSEVVPWIRAKLSPLYIKGTCGRENISKIFRTRPNPAAHRVRLGNEGTTAIRCTSSKRTSYPIRHPHRSSMAGARLVSRLTTASRRTMRGLDTSLSPRPISPPCGERASVAQPRLSQILWSVSC